MTITIIQKATWDNGKTADVDIVCKAHPSLNRCDVPAADLFDVLLEYTDYVNNVEHEALLFEVER